MTTHDDWTAAICDRLASLMREHPRAGICDPGTGEEANDAIIAVHGYCGALIIENTGLRADCADRDRTIADLRAEAKESDETWMRRVDELQGEISTLAQRASGKAASAATADTSADAKTTAAAFVEGMPVSTVTGKPASACETLTLPPPTPDTAGHTMTKPGASDGPQRTVFVVMAHRGGDNENHTYCAAVCENETQARQSAEACEQYRGGKYSCSIWRHSVGVFDEQEPYEVLKEQPIPGWKTAFQRMIDDQRRDKDIALLRAALIRIVVMCGGATTTDVSTEFLCAVPDEVAAALRVRESAAVGEKGRV